MYIDIVNMIYRLRVRYLIHQIRFTVVQVRALKTMPATNCTLSFIMVHVALIINRPWPFV